MNISTIYSDTIIKAVQCAITDGNEVAEISEGWAKVKQVIHMRRPLTKTVREQIAHSGLRYWSTEPTPHNKAEEGFTDDAERVAMTFPR